MICKNCGVELEDEMLNCPLCGEPAIENHPASSVFVPAISGPQPTSFAPAKMSQPQKKLTWEVVSIILLSGAIATLAVDWVINRRIVWSEYPLAVCLTIFCYFSLFAFWNQSTLLKMTGGLLLSSLCLVLLDIATGGIRWAVRVAIPILFSSNLIVAILIEVIRRTRYKGINLIAYMFLGATLLCLAIESILLFFETGLLQLHWSVIVAACTIPVVFVLLFVHFRLKRGRSLEKTFHV